MGPLLKFFCGYHNLLDSPHYRFKGSYRTSLSKESCPLRIKLGLLGWWLRVHRLRAGAERAIIDD